MPHSSAPKIAQSNVHPVAETQNNGLTDQASHNKIAKNGASSEHSIHLRPRLWQVLLLLALIGGSILWFLLRGQSESDSEAPAAISVELQRLQESNIEDSSRFVGQLEAQQGIVLLAETEGRVTQIFASSGDRVAAGDPIVQLSPNRSEAEYRSAVAAVRAARSSRSTAFAELEVAEADRISAESEVSLQQKQIQRTEALVAQGALAQEELDRVIRDIESAQAASDAATRRVSAARSELAQAEADIESAQADADAVREDLDDTLVVAPIAGQVGDVSMKLGDYITSSTPLTTIVQNEMLDLELAVPIERRGDLRLGMPVELLAEDGEQTASSGSLSFISPQTNADSQMVQAEATFRNPTGQIQDAQRVRAHIIWAERRGILVPTEAISRVGGATFVYLAVPGKETETGEVPLVAEQRSVELGDIQDNHYQVISGLNPGDRIVVSGILNVSDGATLTAETADDETADGETADTDAQATPGSNSERES